MGDRGAEPEPSPAAMVAQTERVGGPPPGPPSLPSRAVPTGSLGGDRPVVDVRVVLFTVTAGSLLVALQGPTRAPRLPRGLPGVGEPLDAAARRIVRGSTALSEQYLEQLYTLSVPDDPSDPTARSWTVVVSYMALIVSGTGHGADAAPAPAAGVTWCAMDADPALVSTDRMVLDYAQLRLQAKLGYTTIAFHLLPQTFTLSELQRAYEAILGRPLDKRNFRRRVTAAGILTQTAEQRRDGSHRPAALYRFRAEHDRESYLTPPWSGGS